MKSEKPQNGFEWTEAYLPSGDATPSQVSSSHSDAAILLLADSEKAAKSLGCEAIGSEHLFAACLRFNVSGIRDLLRASGITLTELRSEIVREWGIADAIGKYHRIPFTPRNRRIIEHASRMAQSESRLVEPKDILLALLQEKRGLVVKILHEKKVNVATLMEAIAES